MPVIARRPSILGRAAAGLLATFAIVVLASPAAAATESIRITDRLSRPELTVPAGTTIRWVNRDDERHRMRSQRGPSRFDSGNLEPGESFSVRLTAAGTYRYLDERDDDNRRYFGTIVVRSGGGGGSAGGGSGGGDAPGSDGAGGAARTAEVGMAGRAFGPSTVRIATGGTVTFRNDDDREHTVTSTTDAFDSGVLGEGGAWRHRFATAGTFPFLCAIHPDMTGEVVVTAAAPPAEAPVAPAPTPTPTADPSPTPTSDATPPADPDATSGSAFVEMQDFRFSAAELTVEAGTTVTWRNVGAAPHTVTAENGGFDSGMVAVGAAFDRTFDAPGTFAYVCAFHPEMSATITVTAAGGAGVTGGAGGAHDGAGAEPATPATALPGSGAVEPGEDGAAAAEPAAARAPALPGADGLARFGLVVLLVGGAVALFMRTISGVARRPA